MNLCTTKFHKNQKMVKFREEMFWGEFHRGGGVGNLGVEFREKKMKCYKFPSENEYMYKFVSKSENGNMVKFRGKIFWARILQGRGKFRGGILKKK